MDSLPPVLLKICVFYLAGYRRQREEAEGPGDGDGEGCQEGSQATGL